MESLAATVSSPRGCTRGFWQPMDTLRDKQHLNALWDVGRRAVEALARLTAPMAGAGDRVPLVRRPARPSPWRISACSRPRTRSSRRSPSGRTRSAIRCAPRCARSASWCRWISTSRRRSCSATTCTSPRTRRTGWRTPSATRTWRAAASVSRRTSLVVELASNDGYLLKNFLADGHPGARHRPLGYGGACGRAHRRTDAGRVLRRDARPQARRARAARPISSSPTTCSRTCRSSTISSPASRRS